MNSKITKILLSIAVMVCTLGAARAHAADPYFPLPDVPEIITDFNERADFVVTHYWDRCNFKNAFSSRAGMAEMFSGYLDLLPVASSTAVHESIDKLLKDLKKTPEGLLFLVSEAEKRLYSDTAAYTSDEVFLKFVDAAVKCKKIDKAEKARYQKIQSRLSNSQIGQHVPDIKIQMRDGSQTTLRKLVDADTTKVTIIYLFDPQSTDDRLSRLRLKVDSRFNGYIDAGSMQVIALYPAKADEAFKEAASSMADNWLVGASEEADSKMDMLVYPGCFIVGTNGDITRKNITPDQLLYLIYSI